MVDLVTEHSEDCDQFYRSGSFSKQQSEACLSQSTIPEFSIPDNLREKQSTLRKRRMYMKKMKTREENENFLPGRVQKCSLNKYFLENF